MAYYGKKERWNLENTFIDCKIRLGKQLEDNKIDKSREDEDDINPHGFNFGFGW